MKVELTFEAFGENISLEYELRMPNTAELALLTKQTQMHDPVVASRSFVLSLLDGESKERFLKDIEQYPGIVVALANKMTSACGVSAEVVRKN